jgi:hypothetical protein
MVTNYPERLALGRPETAPREQPSLPLFTRMVRRVNQGLCGLVGHNLLLHFEERRVLLQCHACGYRSPGWDVGDRQPKPRFAGDASRHALIRPAPALARQP